MQAGSFVKYDKMGESSGSTGAAAGKLFIDSYVVTEKVHGANFCVIASKPSPNSAVIVRFAKRTAIIGGIEDAEDFYGCRSAGLLRHLAPSAEGAFQILEASDSQESPLQAVHVYGELFGGCYPHQDVPAIPGLRPRVVEDIYLSDMAADVCRESGFMFAETLFRGTLAECSDFEIEFETTIPCRLRLPPLPLGASGERNLAEGCVVRPVGEPPSHLEGVRAGKESTRGLFKRKIAQFSEKRYQNEDWKKGKAGAEVHYSMPVEELVSIEVVASVTEQRLDNVLSKIGRVDIRDQQGCRRVLEDFKQDVRESLEDADLEVLRGSADLEETLDKLSRSLIKQRLLGKNRTDSSIS
eukprot:CAMPEP_0169371354 /NCGR_PEP_ID=MMETSP1017-20121227/35848_1 /TAXON_ID=342587 /ORGANISM="Karlodinium micrum, Strain CCMP2283" /LENGTH=353 /DNA_ID=CAMNT_0009469837 /DNA_START=54 /DNA_END=1114 /DNA_ORIENTATION=+